MATTFEYDAPAGFMIIGFWGAAGDVIDRLGVILRRIPEPPVPKIFLAKKFIDQNVDNGDMIG